MHIDIIFSVSTMYEEAAAAIFCCFTFRMSPQMGMAHWEMSSEIEMLNYFLLSLFVLLLAPVGFQSAGATVSSLRAAPGSSWFPIS